VHVLGKCDDDAFDSVLPRDYGRSVGETEVWNMPEFGAQFARVLVYKSNELKPVFWMLQQLARDELSDRPGADHDGALDV
jgi:hypothetical protein